MKSEIKKSIINSISKKYNFYNKQDIIISKKIYEKVSITN